MASKKVSLYSVGTNWGLAAKYGKNYIIGNGGEIRDNDMVSLDIDDGTAQNVTLVVNDEYGSPFTETLKLDFGAYYGGDYKQALKGSKLDARKGRTGDDLERSLDEAFEGDGFDLGGGNVVGREIVDMETVKLSFKVGSSTDTVTLTGDYVDGYLEEMFEAKNAVIDAPIYGGQKGAIVFSQSAGPRMDGAFSSLITEAIDISAKDHVFVTFSLSGIGKLDPDNWDKDYLLARAEVQTGDAVEPVTLHYELGKVAGDTMQVRAKIPEGESVRLIFDAQTDRHDEAYIIDDIALFEDLGPVTGAAQQ